LDVLVRHYQRIAGSEPPPYHTAYDRGIHEALTQLLDSVLEAVPGGSYALLVDARGFAPAHNSRYSHPPSGDPAQDIARVRHKRIFDDPVGARLAANTETLLFQNYSSDKWEILKHISVALILDSEHCGGVRMLLHYFLFQRAPEAGSAPGVAV
ncbi:chemotaxis protein, partial [Achromobacter xylosoxidans]